LKHLLPKQKQLPKNQKQKKLQKRRKKNRKFLTIEKAGLKSPAFLLYYQGISGNDQPSL
jgi:hypothetical protein